MPKGYRYVILAVAGWVTLAAAYPPDKASPQQAPDNKIQPALHTSVTPATQGDKPYSPADHSRCSKASDKKTDELCVQWRSTVATEKAADAAKTANYVAGAGAILSFISILLVLDALSQARLTNRIAMGESERSTRRAVAAGLETDRALAAAERSAEASAALVESSRDTARKQLRAYTGFNNSYFVDLRENDPRATTGIINSGRTPAIDVEVKASVAMNMEPVAPTPPITQKLGLIEPGQGKLVVFGLGVKIHEDWFARLRSGEVKIYFWGTISYTDIYGVRHEKIFNSHVSHRRIDTVGPIGFDMTTERETDTPA